MVPKSTRKTVASSRATVALSVEDLVPDPDQPRKTFAPDALSSLAKNLLETGQISPIVVRPGPRGKYIIVVGERRWRAARDVGLSYVECVIREDIDGQKAREMQLAENYQREDVPPLEQARAWRRYLDEYKVSQSELSRRTGIPQRTISDRLALLSLPASVHARIEAGEIGPYEALKIAALPAHQQEELADTVSSGRIGGRMLDKVVKMARTAPEKSVRDIISQLASPQAVALSSAERGEVELNKGIRKAELESEVGRTKMPPELASMIAIALDSGRRKRNKCGYLKEGVCRFHFHTWPSRDEMPEGAGEPVQTEKPKPHWHVKPTPLFCALCPMSPELEEVDGRLIDTEIQVLTNPLSGIQSDFKCECGATEFVAVRVECTKCGREAWCGWFPEQ